MQENATSGTEINNAITSDEILGKDVIDNNGDFIGVVEKVFIDPQSLQFIGISIDKGFFKHGLSIGKSYIKKITKHALFLNIRVAHQIKNMIVYDKNGKKIGVVSTIDLEGNKNKIKKIRIRREGIFAFLRKELTVAADEIKNIGENIILKMSYEDILNQHQKNNFKE